MTAEQLFLEKGFVKSITDTEIVFTKGDGFIKFSLTDRSYWHNLTDITDLKPAIQQQNTELGWV